VKRARNTPLWGVYIPHFDQISVKISVLGVLFPYCCTDGGEIWHGGGDLWFLLRAKFHPHRCNVSPLWGKKLQNRPLSKLNTGMLFLPVKILKFHTRSLFTNKVYYVQTLMWHGLSLISADSEQFLLLPTGANSANFITHESSSILTQQQQQHVTCWHVLQLP